MQSIGSRFCRPLVVVSLALITFGGTTGLAWAATNATSQNITITPSSTELSVAPGSSAASSFDVVNEGNNAYNVTVSVAPYHVEGVDYDPQFTPLPGTTDASKWVHITDLPMQTLAAHKLTNVNYVLSVPAGTTPGGYY